MRVSASGVKQPLVVRLPSNRGARLNPRVVVSSRSASSRVLMTPLLHQGPSNLCFLFFSTEAGYDFVFKKNMSRPAAAAEVVPLTG
jgi:hypothetical protein